MKANHSKVMTIANRLVSQGITRAAAMLQAWAIVKNPLIETNVVGVTRHRRQEAIEHLTRYDPAQIHIQLQRESGNQYDRNAIAVIATVAGRGSYQIGYLSKSIARLLPRSWTQERPYWACIRWR